MFLELIIEAKMKYNIFDLTADELQTLGNVLELAIKTNIEYASRGHSSRLQIRLGKPEIDLLKSILTKITESN